MPQLDFLIFASQTIFLLFFIFGYFIFLKYILPIIAFEIKINEIVELYYLKWFFNNKNKLYFNPKIYLALIKNMNNLLKYFINLGKLRNYIFGIWYNQDVTYLRHLYRSKYENRFM